MKTISRRNALLAGFSSLITFGITSAYAAPASVPVIWDGKKMFESFEKEGTGISSKGPAGRPKAYVALIHNAGIVGSCTENWNPF